MENHYEVLGLKRGASEKEISAAYRSKALQLHPDKRHNSVVTAAVMSAGDADELFIKVKAAHQALMDPKLRAELDLRLLGEEERRLRDEQMSGKRKEFKQNLLNRERQAATASTPRPNSYQPGNEDSTLVVRYKAPASIKPDAVREIICQEFDSDPATSKIVSVHLSSPTAGATLTNRAIVEFSSPQEAFLALQRLTDGSHGSIGVVVDADWYLGRLPSSLVSSKPAGPAPRTSDSSPTDAKKVKYSAGLEASILAKLKQKQHSQKQ